MKPIIGSHHSIRDQVHLWHFQRTSGLPRDYFKQPSRGDIAVWIFCLGVLAGILSGLIVEWLS
jgi:hypothetical protein